MAVAKVKRQIHPSRLIVLAFFGVVAVGTALLSMPFTSADGKATSFTDALFTATSAVTVTGLTSVDTELHWNLSDTLLSVSLSKLVDLESWALRRFWVT